MFIEYGGKAPRISTSAFVAPTATLIGDVVVGENAAIWFGVVLRADTGSIRIGARTSIEDNAVVHSDGLRATVVGADVTVGHCAVLDGCTVEDGALIGSNAVILDGAVIEAGALVGAGSVVTIGTRIAAASMAAGSPARVRKAVAGRAAQLVSSGAREACSQGQAYRRDNLGDPHHHELKSVNRKRAPVTIA